MPECPMAEYIEKEVSYGDVVSPRSRKWFIQEYIDIEEIFQRNICSVGICEYVKKEED